jgi:hypothetical protein
MSDLEFWLEYGLAIFFVGSLIIMIVAAIAIAEIKEYQKRKKKK